jgi:hypothetical protein
MAGAAGNVSAQEQESYSQSILQPRLEQQTARGSVPPATASVGGQALGDEQASVAESGAVDAKAAAATLAAFRSAYQRAGSPRLAVYFNRELSEEVREWIPGDQQIIQVQVDHALSGQSLASGPISAQQSSQARTEIQRRHYVGKTGYRADPGELWMWQFEDAITARFLEGKAKVVDRAVIFRQMARLQPQPGMDGTESTSLNEISALDRFADILVEMRIAPTSRGNGYNFRASAKDVKSGRILASAIVGGANRRWSASGRYVATPNGYELQESVEDPAVEAVAHELTLKLMTAMTPQLGR